MQYSVARGALSMIANMGRRGHLADIGMTEEDFEKVVGSEPWCGLDKIRMKQALNCLLTTTIDSLGLPRHQLPAEFISAGICMFVNPVNSLFACRLMENVPTAMAMGRGADESEICTARQLFALTVQLYADPSRSHARILFEKNTSLALENIKGELLNRAIEREGRSNGRKNK